MKPFSSLLNCFGIKTIKTPLNSHRKLNKLDQLNHPQKIDDQQSISKPSSNMTELIEDYIQSELLYWNIPGASISVVMNNKILICKGFGKCSINHPIENFTDDTFIPIGGLSNTFVVAAISQLVDQKLINWNSRLHEFIPEIQFSDSWIQQNITVVDLLSHRSGLAAYDDSVIEKLGALSGINMQVIQSLQFCSDFRNSFVYNKIGYSIIVYLIEKLSRMSFKDYVTTYITDPLGIQCVWSNKEFLETKHAKPHQLKVPNLDINLRDPESLNLELIQTVMTSVGDRDNSKIDGIYMSTRNMTKWVQCWMNNGHNELGTQIVYGLDTITKVHNSSMARKGKYFDMCGYGCGIFCSSIDSYMLYSHFGNTPGYSCNMLFSNLTPSTKVGIYFSCNTDFNNVHLNACLSTVLKLLEHHQSMPYDGYVRKLKLDAIFDKFDEINFQRHTFMNGKITIPTRLQDYIGNFYHPAYGTVTISHHERSGCFYIKCPSKRVQTLHQKRNQSNSPTYAYYTLTPNLEIGTIWYFQDINGDIVLSQIDTSGDLDIMVVFTKKSYFTKQTAHVQNIKISPVLVVNSTDPIKKIIKSYKSDTAKRYFRYSFDKCRFLSSNLEVFTHKLGQVSKTLPQGALLN
ncbi:beta-lactamase/transpeptidase-like protein [Globomyces pollinis-pini]|nr:beta-lactamase/transpeptidase-like protein [Globomyces pollinis-pini]